jgi:hypothetical protein
MTDRGRLQVAQRDLIRIAERAGLPEPDEVRYREEEGEVELLWHDRKLAVIVECGPDCEAPHGPADAPATRRSEAA